MTAQAHQVSARELGGGRWRVELEVGGAAGVRRRDVSVIATDATAPRASVESAVVPAGSARDRLSLVLAVDGPRPRGPVRLELRGAGWSGHVHLGPPDEPRLRAPHAPGPVPAALDYRARDFDALRTMLQAVIEERFAADLDAHPVSQTTAVVEQMAYLGDALSYGQDAILTEAYLAKARRRLSVTRHAALLDYRVGRGASARAWIRFEAPESLRLPAGTLLLAYAPDLPPRVAPGVAVPPGAIAFETVEPVDVEPDHIPYGLAQERLLPGATTARLAGPCERLRPGGLVLIGPAPHVVRVTHVQRDRDTTHVTWADADALPAGGAYLEFRAGNLVVAEQGRTLGWEPLAPPEAGRRYQPALPHARPAGTVGAVPGDDRHAAADTLAATGRTARPAVSLMEGVAPVRRRWVQRETLLESGPLDPGFVVELDDDVARLRFGDGTNGMRPAPGTHFEVRMRAGKGAAGNVAAGAIEHVVSAHAALRARNPTAAVGGVDPEPLSRVRLNAPRAYRSTDRAVTAPQYAAAARAVRGVSDADAMIARSGTGPVARVRVHSGTWDADTDHLVARVRRALERRRPLSVALDVQAAAPSPATIALEVLVRDGWTVSSLTASIGDALRADLLIRGRFGFGDSLHRSDLIRLLAGVPGVASVTVSRFGWYGDPSAQRRETLEPPFGHIIRISDDPARPAHGSVTFRMGRMG